MTRKVKAIFENGVFRPLEPVEGIPEKAEAEVEVRVQRPLTGKETVEQFAGLLGWDEAEEMMRIIEEDCERIEPDEPDAALP